jgi:hypothetical protein
MLTSDCKTWIITHMDHVHIALILIIVLVIVHLGDNSAILLMSKWTQISPAWGSTQIPIFTTQTGASILISRGKLKPWEIVLSNTMICTTPRIPSSITNLLLLHPTIIRDKNYHWKTHSKHIHKRWNRIYKSSEVSKPISPTQGLTSDECQILCIWTPWFALVRHLALLFSNVLVSVPQIINPRGGVNRVDGKLFF